MKTAIELVIKERQRQIESEGFTTENDDRYKNEELAYAASCYAMPSRGRDCNEGVPIYWPWSDEWWKSTPNDRIRELVKSTALNIAEIERLQRLEQQP